LSVQSAEIEGQFNRNIPDGATVAAMVKSQATGYGGAAAASPGQAASAKPEADPTAAPAPVQAVPAQAPAPAPAPAAQTVYKIGDTGPAGGIIFYDKKVFTNGWRYLEAMPAEMEFTAQWGTSGTDVRNTETSMGSGKRNSQLIMEALKQSRQNDRAAEICVNMEFGGYKDWFLPSKDELDLMYKNLKRQDLGGFGDGLYWSSSQYDAGGAYTQRFRDGEISWGSQYYKNSTNSVRAIRQF
jgi:hypothetical protein